MVNRAYNTFVLKIKRVEYDCTVKINGRIRIFGQGKIEIGRNTRINSSLIANPLGGMTYTLLCTKSKGRITIGEHTGMSNCAIVSQTHVQIGSRCKIGGDVKIYDTDFHSISFSERTNRETDIAKSKEIIIEDDVFIGAHSIILKGVHVGSGAVIGAGSVVTKNIPANEVWGGNPVQFIKKM